jgi:hypothetical protein
VSSLGIAIALLGLALMLAAVVKAGRTAGRRRYPARPPAPYARFREPRPGERLMRCEGWCAAVTFHEPDGDGGATCIVCGGTRPAATPGPAVAAPWEAEAAEDAER